MLSLEKKEALWKKVLSEFPSDAMMRELHFVRAVMEELKHGTVAPASYRELGITAREEIGDWFAAHSDATIEHSSTVHSSTRRR